MDIKSWFTDQGGNNATSPDGAPEGMKRSGVNNTIRELMAAVKRFFDRPDMREPFEDFTLQRTTGEIWIFVDNTETNAFALLEDGQRIRMTGTAGADSGKVWEGFVDDSVTPLVYAPPNTTFGVTWLELSGGATAAGPTLDSAVVEVGAKELGRAAWYDTGASTGNIPLYDDLDPHVSTPEASLDVGFIDGVSREKLEVAGARGRMNPNGGFDFWSRGTNFTAATSLNNDDGNLFADQFVLISDGNDVATVSRSTDTPSAAVRYSALFTTSTVPGANEKYGFVHIMEEHDSYDGIQPAGGDERVSVSFWAKVGPIGGISNLRATILELKSASPGTHPVNAWLAGSTGALTYEPTNWREVGAADTAVPITASWTEFKIENIQTSASGQGIGPFALVLHVDEATLATGSQWVVSAVQFNRGAKALPFLRIPAALEQAWCERYCETTFSDGSQPQHNGSNSDTVGSASGAGFLITYDWRFRVPKFKAPTIVFYNPLEALPPATGEWARIVGDSVVASAANVNEKGVSVRGTATVANARHSIAMYCHANIWGNN
jgi:hypothetical protein